MKEAVTINMAEGPKGIRGWLWVFAIPLVLNPVALALGVFQGINGFLGIGPLLNPGHVYYSPWWAPLILGEVLYLAAALVGCCWLLVLFFGQKSKFPASWIRVNVMVAIFLLFDAVGMWLMWRQFPAKK